MTSTSRKAVTLVVAALLLPTAAVMAASGSDSFGYIWLDQNEPGVTSSIPPPSGPPVVLTLSDEQVTAPIPLGFNFPFYGGSYPSFVLSDNGWLSFDLTNTSPTPIAGSMPAPGPPNLTLAWYWRDLAAPSIVNYFRFAGGGYLLLRTTTISDPGNLIQIYVVMYQTGVIKIYYVLVNDPITATVGIENATGGIGLSPWSAGVGGSNGFDLNGSSVVMYFPPAVLSCATSTPILCGQTLRGTSPATVPTNVNGYLCSGSSIWGAKIYQLTTTQLSDVTVSLANITAGVDVDVFLLSAGACNEFQCLGGGTDTFTKSFLPAGTYYIVVDGKAATDNGNFDLTVTCTPKSAASFCGATSVAGSTSGASQWAVYGCTNQVMDGPEFLYEVPFTPPGNLKVTLQPQGGAELDLMVFGPDAFAPPAGCLAWGDNNITLFDPAPGTYYVMVDGRTNMGTTIGQGSYTLDIDCAVLLDCTAPATDLTCGVETTGTTIGATNRAEQYSCSPDLLTGGEVVYRFTNPIQRTVSFRYVGPPDLRLMLVKSTCNEGSCVVQGNGRLVARNLDAGDYFLVVDGVNGATGDHTITPVCDNSVDPPSGSWTLNTCQSVHETKRVTVNADITRGDVVFAMDLTGSMGIALANLKITTQAIITELANVIDDVQFGLASFEDYPASFSSCGYSSGYGGGADLAYRLNLPVTNNLAALFSAIDGLTLGGGSDLPEGYSRTYAEMYLDAANLGWRSGARRITVMIGDDEPHSCDATYCGTPRTSTGADPGRNNTAGDFDDLEITAVMAEFLVQGITPIYLFTGNPNKPTLLDPWQCWTRAGGGESYDSPGGTAPPTLVDDIRLLIESKSLFCNLLEAKVTPGYGAWITNLTPVGMSVTLPAIENFDFDLAPPVGTAPGVYNFDVEFLCDGIVKARQTVEITVPPLCLAAIGSVTPGCALATTILDASGSTSCCASLEYRWLDGATPVCNWSTTPTCAVAPSVPTTYTLEIRCAGGGECGTLSASTLLDVVPGPTPVMNPIADNCAGGMITLDAAGSNGNGCTMPLEYQFRQGVTILQAWSTASIYGPFAPAATATYTVDVRCPVGTTGCIAATTQDATIVPYPLPVAGADRRICAMDPLVLDGSGSTDLGCNGGLVYEWRLGATVVSPWSSTPTWNPPTTTPGNPIYTLAVRCASAPTCETTDDIQIVIDNCSLAVHFDSVDAQWGQNDRVDVSWTTSMEDGSVLFAIERAATIDGTFAMLGTIDAHGPNVIYRFVDETLPQGSRPWYRIVEYTFDGRGDVSPSITPHHPAASETGRRRPGAARNRGH